MRLSLEHCRRQLPEGGDVRLCRTNTQTRANVSHACRCGGSHRRVGRFHQHQQLAFQQGSRGRVGLARDGALVSGQIAPLPIDHPQVGRVNPLGPGGLLHNTILRKHRQRRHRFAGQQPTQVIEQSKRCMFDVGDQRRGEHVRLGSNAQKQRFAGAQNGCRCRKPDHFEGAHALMNLRARNAQHGGVDRIDVGAGRRLGFLDKTAQRLVRRFQRAPQLVVHPGQSAEVVAGLR